MRSLLGPVLAVAVTVALSDVRSAELSPADWRAIAIARVGEVDDLAVRGDLQYELAYVLARAGDLAEARRAASGVIKPQKRVYAYSFVAKRHRDLGDLEAARAVLDQCHASLMISNAKTRKDWLPYLVTAYAEAGLADETLPLVEQLNEPFRRERVLVSVLTSLYMAKKTAEAEQYAAAQLDREQTQRGMADAVSYLASSKRVEEAWVLAQRLERSASNDNAMVSVSRALAVSNRPAEAVAAMEKVTDAAKRASAAVTAAAEQASRESIDVLRARAAQATTREGKTALTEKIVQALAEEGRPAEAEAAIDDLVRDIETAPRDATATKFGLVDDSVAVATARALHFTVAREMVKRGALDASRQQVGKAREAIMALKPETGLHRSMLINALAGAEISTGRLGGAVELMDQLKGEALAAGREAGAGHHLLSSVARQVAVAQVRAGDVASAMETAELIVRHGGGSSGQGDLLGDVAAVLIETGDVPSAKRLLERLSDTLTEAEAFRDAGAAMARAGRGTELNAWESEMKWPAAQAMACLGAAEPR